MSASWRNYCEPQLACRFAAALLACVALEISSAQATITVTGDPAGNYGTNPAIFTVDPWDAAVTARANIGLTQDRRIRQTFKNPTTFNVGEIVFSFDVTGGSTEGVNAAGLSINIYEVADVGASSWTAGTLIKTLTHVGLLPGANRNLSFALSGGDVFTLPQRDSGTTGYGIEFTTAFANSSDGNPGVLYFPNISSPVTDFYTNGRLYNQNGAAQPIQRDLGVSFLASTETACSPGDVTCSGGVTIEDLQIIAAHFRQNGARENGDLTGDGFIDFDDFDQWKRNYGGPGLGSEAFAFLSVPEPNTLAITLLALTLAGPLVGRRGKRAPIAA